MSLKSLFAPMASLAFLGLLALTLPTSADAQIFYGAPIVVRPRTTSINRGNRNINRSTRSTTTSKKAASTAQKRVPGQLKTALGKLGLTEAQKSLIDGFQASADKQGAALYENRALSGRQASGETENVNRTMLANIASVLTPEQKKRFVSLMPELKTEALVAPSTLTVVHGAATGGTPTP